MPLPASVPPGRVPWLRLVLAVSLDGRLAPPEGGAAQLGGAPDRQLLEEALAWADACLIGAGTLRQHGTTCLIHDPALLQRRRQAGAADQPLAIVISGSGALEPGLRFFRQPLRRWLLQLPPGPVSAESGADGPGSPPPGFERMLRLPGWPQALAALAESGLERLVVLGGARLAASLLAEDRLDELQLTVCPLLLGGPHAWVPAGFPGAPEPRTWELLEARALQGGEAVLRYRRPRPDEGSPDQGSGRDPAAGGPAAG